MCPAWADPSTKLILEASAKATLNACCTEEMGERCLREGSQVTLVLGRGRIMSGERCGGQCDEEPGDVGVRGGVGTM